jgi:hypothetical protein
MSAGPISDKEQAEMKQTAGGLGGDYESLGEYLSQQLEKAQGAQESFEEYQPTAKANAEAIGSFEGRAPGESPVDIRAQGLTTAQAISSTASKTQGNILDVITSMMNLKKQKEADEQRIIDNKMKQQEYELSLAEKGMKINEDGDLVGMTDEEKKSSALYSLDPVVWLKSQPGGLKIAQNETSVAGLETTAKAIYEAGGIENYLRSNPTAIYSSKEEDALRDKKDILFSAEAALAYFDEGEDGNLAPGIGKFQGIIPNWKVLIGSEGQNVRKEIATITNDKIKQLSGAAVSDQEAKRLAQQLPNNTDDDSLVKSKLEDIVASIRIGEEMKIKSIVEGITLDEAYQKYGSEAYVALGQSIPPWLEKATEGESEGKSEYTPEYDVDAAMEKVGIGK